IRNIPTGSGLDRFVCECGRALFIRVPSRHAMKFDWLLARGANYRQEPSLSQKLLRKRTVTRDHIHTVLPAALVLRPEGAVAHAKIGIGHNAADCRVQSLDTNDRNASRFRTENLTRAAKL